MTPLLENGLESFLSPFVPYFLLNIFSFDLCNSNSLSGQISFLASTFGTTVSLLQLPSVTHTVHSHNPIQQSHHPLLHPTMQIARRFSITNFAIATSALAFQVFVLYPWHNKLDQDFKELKEENIRLLQKVEVGRSEQLKEIREAFVRARAT